MNFKRQNSMSNNNNTPPPWSEAPPWAKWRAMDESGEWWWFADRPWNDNTGGWYLSKEAYQIAFGGQGDSNPNWQDTIEKRPKNEPS